MSSARKVKVIASVPVPTPTACATLLAAANSRSNASTSGPSTNQPLAMTRSIAALMSAASSPGLSALNGTIVDSALSVDILRHVTAVIVERPLETFTQCDRGAPTGPAFEQRRVGVETADVDRLLFRRPVDKREAS